MTGGDRKLLYHFTPDHLLKGCLREGLTEGVTPIKANNLLGLLIHNQWLTTDPEFTQEWCNGEFRTLPYDRQANRLTIEIPVSEQHQLYPFSRFRRKIRKIMIPDFDYGDDCKNWFVFIGRVSPAWIIEVDRKPSLAKLMDEAIQASGMNEQGERR